MTPQVHKARVLAHLDRLALEAPEGPRVRNSVTENSSDKVREAYSDWAACLSQYDLVEFSIAGTTYRVRNESNWLEYLRGKVSALPLQCFKIPDFF